MPGTTTTIDKEQRDGLYELVRNHLGGIGDIWIALEQDGEYMLAERMGIEFGEDFRLLADLGWEPEDKRKTVELTMEAHDLAELLTRLRGEAEGVLDGTTGMRLQREEEERANALYQGAKDTCEELLARLDGERRLTPMPAKLKRLRPGQLDCLVLDHMKAAPQGRPADRHLHRQGPRRSLSRCRRQLPYAPGRRRKGSPGQTNSSRLRPQAGHGAVSSGADRGGHRTSGEVFPVSAPFEKGHI